MYSFFRSSQAFTLMELMLVIAILMILFMVVSVPYGYYAERARVRDGASRIEQVWTLAHSSVQNGAVVA
jgi:prepilin-type N-terminal cleavage/methylation domain-containing protein